jgi:hypothetical protein
MRQGWPGKPFCIARYLLHREIDDSTFVTPEEQAEAIGTLCVWSEVMFAHVFGPPELEIIEQAHKLACGRLARSPFRDAAKQRDREKALRDRLFFFARRGDDAESLCERVLATVPESWISMPPRPSPRRCDRRVA